MPATYEPIATVTLGSTSSPITFSSIGATYTDLRLVLVGTNNSAGQYVFMRLNSDSGTNYSQTGIFANGTSTSAYTSPGSSLMGIVDNPLSTTIPNMQTFDIFSYAGSLFKTILMIGSTDKNGSGSSEIAVGLWRNTVAITSVTLFPGSGTFNVGTSATLYGIKAA